MVRVINAARWLRPPIPATYTPELGHDEVALGARSEDAGPVEIAETVPGDGKSPVEWLGQIPTRLQAGPSRIGAGGAP
jgi:hypothetical protein